MNNSTFRPLAYERPQVGIDVEALRTFEECDAARDKVTQAIADIEGQLDLADKHHERGGSVDGVWWGSAKSALRWHKLELQRIAERRGAIQRAEQNAQNQAWCAATNAHTAAMRVHAMAMLELAKAIAGGSMAPRPPHVSVLAPIMPPAAPPSLPATPPAPPVKRQPAVVVKRQVGRPRTKAKAL